MDKTEAEWKGKERVRKEKGTREKENTVFTGATNERKMGMTSMVGVDGAERWNQSVGKRHGGIQGSFGLRGSTPDNAEI